MARRVHRWWLGVVIALLVGGIALSAVSAHEVAARHADSAQRSFDSSARDVASTVRIDVQRSADLTVAITGWLTEHPTATTAEFNSWVSDIRTYDRYPEFQGVGLMVLVPDAQRDAFARELLADATNYSPSQRVFNVTPPGRRPEYCFLRLTAGRPTVAQPLGLDVCASGTADRLFATRDSGAVSYDAVQFPTGTYLGIQTPVYRTGAVPGTVAERRAEFRGWLGTLLDPALVLQEARSGHDDLAVKLHYRSTLSDVTFTSGRPAEHGAALQIPFGNGWVATVTGAPISRSIAHDGTALIVLIGGMLLTLTAVALGVVLATGRARAQRLVRERTEELHHLALHDPLTGLANRALIIDRLENLLARARRTAQTPAVLYLDVDGFKGVNDAYGHAAGDELLLEVARRLTATVRHADTIGRLGGDEFVVLLEIGNDGPAAEIVADRVVRALRQPCNVGADRPLVVSCSIGVATGDRPVGDDLLRDADAALYRAKFAGRDRVELYDPTVAAADDSSLEHEVRTALELGQLRLVYQPTYDVADLALRGVEALLRWEHPTRGTIEPHRVIPLLERSGQIIEVGRWVLRTACAQMAAWHENGAKLMVSVNVSARQFENDVIVDDVRDALADTGLDPGSLTIEVTETAMIRDLVRVSGCVQRLKAFGIHIAIDDFGTGYSSLAYLRELAVDTIKIDRSFIAGAPGNDRGAIVRAIVQLGRDLGLTTVAEGVETTDQMDRLRAEEVDGVQGFLFARPLDPETFEATWLAGLETAPTP